MKAYKKFKSTTGVEYNFYVRVDGNERFVSLKGPGKMIIVTDPMLAKAIENSTHFKTGKIILESVVGNMSSYNPEIIPAQAERIIQQEVPVEADTKVTNYSHSGVKNMGDAVEVLVSKYGVKESDVIKKAQVLAKAAELGVKFPNYR